MSQIPHIDQWQLRRMVILAEMVEAMTEAFCIQAPEEVGEKCRELESQLLGFRDFVANAEKGKPGKVSEVIQYWMEKLESIENDLIDTIFSTLGDDSIELIHDICRREGSKWGKKAAEEKGQVSHDARKALLVLNDYLIDGMPTDDNIEIKSSEARMVTYVTHHCNYKGRFGDSSTLAWALCSSRQAWKDGFFEAFGGVAHQNVSARCQGDDTCMHVITVISE